MRDSFSEKPVVIGAGPAGLSAGWKMASNGLDVIVLEKTDQIGGLAMTFRDGDYRFDLGPHIFHTFHEDVLTFVKKILKDDFQQYRPQTKIFYKDKFVEYPLKGLKVFSVLPPRMVIPAAASFLSARMRLRLGPTSDGDSFTTWITNRFGKSLYDAYFAPYAQKAWMIKASEISKYVAEQKVPELRISDHIRGLFNRPPRVIHGEDASRMEVYYPHKGIGQVTDWFYEQILAQNGKVEHSVDIRSINGKDNRVESITYCQNGQIKTLNTNMLVSSMPITELIASLKMDVPRKVRDAASQLDYVSEVLFYLKTNGKKISDASWVYFSDPEVRFNRVYDVGAFSNTCVPPGKAAYCIEFTCNKDDEIWNASAEDLHQYVIELLETYNIMSHSDVEGYLTKKIVYAYPRFKIGFTERMKTILDYLSTIENLITLGRQGLFCYANVDDALYMGFRAADRIKDLDNTGVDYTQILPDAFL